MMTFYTHRTKHQKLALAVSLCTRMVRLRKYSPITSLHHGYLIGCLLSILPRNFWFLLKKFLTLYPLILQSELIAFRSVPEVPEVPRVSKSQPLFTKTRTSFAHKAPLAPKARFAPRSPSVAFVPTVKKTRIVKRAKPVRLVPLVRRAPSIKRPPLVRAVPTRRY
jgi:hypothetical protein